MISKPPSSLIRFGVTGVAATLVHLVTAAFLIELLNTQVGWANGVAFILATLFSNLVNTYWSFSTSLSKKVFVRFWLVAALGCLLSINIANYVASLGFHYLIGIALIVIIVPSISYVLHRLWTYRS